MRLQRDQFSIDAAVAKGRQLPQWYLEEPLLAPADSFYLRAFGELNTCRAPAFSGPGPIPWDAIIKYGHHAGLDSDMLDVLVIIIRKMDEVFVRWQEQEEKRRAAAKAPPKPSRGGMRQSSAKG